MAAIAEVIAERTIVDLQSLLQGLASAEREAFDRIFTVGVSEATLCYSSPAVRESIGTQFRVPEQFRDVRRAIRMSNRVLGEETLVNPLRASRPIQTTSGDQLEALKFANPRGADCSFCEWEVKTPMDDFGRIETQHSVTAANLYAFDAAHGLVIPKRAHEPSEISEEIYVDMIDAAKLWLETTYKYHPNARFPLIIYNNLPRAGSSIFHPHLQVLAAEGRPYQEVEDLRKRMADYQWFNESPFMDDMAFALRGLGLVHDMGGAHIIFNPVPVKEREVMVYTNDDSKLPNRDLAKAAFSVINWWRSMCVTSFDMVMYLPPLGESNGDWHNFYPLVRMVDRGPEGTKTCDFGAMEIYASSVVSSDQLQQSEAFRKFLK